jgi:hypothetical protein
MTTGRQLEQRNRDREAKDYTDVQLPPGAKFTNIVNTAPLILRNSADDVWTAPAVGSPILIPIDLQNQWMKFHSFLTLVQTSAAVSADVQYTIALYEVQGGAVGSLSSPSSGQVYARLLSGTEQRRNLAVDPGDATTYHDVYELPNDKLLDPMKQYMVWLMTDSVLVSFLYPSQLPQAFGISSPIDGDPPEKVVLSRRGITAALPAPLVQLRSRYGSFHFGDPSRE